jgi:hypothetical protein
LNGFGHPPENRNSRAEFLGQHLIGNSDGTFTAVKMAVHATFFQKVIICAFAGFLAAALIQWAKVFVEGADDALNKGYEHHSVMSSP